MHPVTVLQIQRLGGVGGYLARTYFDSGLCWPLRYPERSPLSSRPLSGTVRITPRWILCSAILIHAIGLWIVGFGSRQTHLGNFLFMVLEFPHGEAVLLERWFVSAFLLTAVLAFVRPRWWTLVPIAGYILFEAWAGYFQGGYRFSELTLGAHALRWATPLAMIGLALPALSRTWQLAWTDWILRGAIATVFVVHGWECLQGYPLFADLIIGTSRNLLGIGIAEATAFRIMTVIGVLDLAVAAVILLRPHPSILLWAAFWGGLTALSRITSLGTGYYVEVLVRASHLLAPLAVLALRAESPAHRASALFPFGSRGPDMQLSTSTSSRPQPALTRSDESRSPASSGQTPTIVLVLIAICVSALSLGASVGPASAQETIRALQPSATPMHLWVHFESEPSRQAVVSWSTTIEGETSVLHLDTEPRDGQVGAYAREIPVTRTGKWTLLDEEAAAGMDAWYHHVSLTELEPATRYYITVETDGEALGEYWFKTAPADDRVVAVLMGGDSRVGNRRVESDNPRRMMNLRMAELLSEHPEIVGLAHTADYTNRAYWSQLYYWLNDHFETATTRDGRLLPIIPSRGNHDLDVGFEEKFWNPERQNDFYYATHVNSEVVLLALNTEISRGGDQRTWLEETLRELRPQSRWMGAFYHKPAYPAVRDFSSGEGTRRAWVSLFEEYGLDFAGAGHDHALKRTAPILRGAPDAEGIVYVGDGGLGVSSREVDPDRWYFQAGGMTKSIDNVHVLRFTHDVLEVRAWGRDGDLLDEFMIPHDRGERARHYQQVLQQAQDAQAVQDAGRNR